MQATGKWSISAAAKTPIIVFVRHHGLDSYMRLFGGPTNETRFSEGHWISHLEEMYIPDTLYIAAIEIAPDGSRNKVEGIALISTNGINAIIDEIKSEISHKGLTAG